MPFSRLNIRCFDQFSLGPSQETVTSCKTRWKERKRKERKEKKRKEEKRREKKRISANARA